LLTIQWEGEFFLIQKIHHFILLKAKAFMKFCSE